jgi:tetratricopeptide (TPR) repeat protein
MRATASPRPQAHGGACAAFLGVAALAATIAPRAAEAIEPAEFLQLPAIEAFKAGRFAEAIQGLRALPVTGPEDAIILRYIALAHQQLGDHAAALAALDEGLAIAPDNAALHYFRAVSLLALGDSAAAADSLRRVQALAPDSLYAQQAHQLLAGAAVPAGAAPAGDERRWTARLEAGVQYDSNIPAATDDFAEETVGFRTFQQAVGSIELWRSGPWTASADADIYYGQHLDAEFRDFDTITAVVGGDLAHLTRLGEVPVSFGAGYHLEGSWVGYDPYSQTHTADLTAIAAFTENSLTQVELRLDVERYEDDGVLPTVTSRDAVGYGAGVTQYLFLDGRDSYLFAGYAFATFVADGSNFDRNTHTVTVGGSTRVLDGLRLDAGVTYLHEDYPDFIGPTERRTDRFDVTLGAAQQIFDNAEIAASWTYIDENSSIDVLSYDRHVGTVSLILSF